VHCSSLLFYFEVEMNKVAGAFTVLDRKKYTHHIIGPPTSFCTFQLFVDRVESSPDEPYLGIYDFTLQSAASRCRAGSSLPL
jgi:hypothetical protein